MTLYSVELDVGSLRQCGQLFALSAEEAARVTVDMYRDSWLKGGLAGVVRVREAGSRRKRPLVERNVEAQS